MIVEGTFDPANLQQAIRAGAVFVSNGPSLIIEMDLGGATLPMGTLHTLPSPIPSATATVRVYYRTEERRVGKEWRSGWWPYL